jgi:PKD repeat protein
VRWWVRFVVIALAVTWCVVLVPPANAAPPGRSAPQPGRIVSDEPARTTPDIVDGTVNSLTEVGDWIVVGGNFTGVQNPGASTTMPRRSVLAFDKATGRVSTAFDLHLNGVVYKVQAAPDGRSVYVGGSFSSAGGASVSNLVKVDVATGDLDTGFTAASLNGQVRDLEVVGDRLYVAGKFTHIGGHAQRALGTMNATTGRYDPYFGATLAGLHNPGQTGAVTDVLQISANPAGTALMAVGNFTTVDGQARSQIARFDIGGAAYGLSPWSTLQYTQACSRSFDTYMTDVEFSPDGSFFVVSSTGAYGGSGSNTGTSGCDVVARWANGNTAGARPVWTAYPGGDTTWTVEVTEDVVYAGGHQRWQNNPSAGDRPGEGAVERTGIAALDAVNGLPYSWNPTRARGVGVQDMVATEEGLYVGSDTELIGHTPGNRSHERVALLPLDGGHALPVVQDYGLPATVATVATGGSSLTRRRFDGDTVTSTSGAPGTTNQPAWGSATGAFMVGGRLYVAAANGTVTVRSFDGTSYGAPEVVDTADALVRQNTWHNSDVPSMTSLFFWKGRMYFTRSGQSQLYSRAFELEDDNVGQQRFTVPGPTGVSMSGVRGAFVADGAFYYADTSGRLFRSGWTDDGTASGPTGTAVQVSGPGVDGQSWSSRAMFVQQGSAPAPNREPTAAMTVTCSGTTCDFDALGSVDPDGTIATYDWDFGDGSVHGHQQSASHTYADPGDHEVTLTVTDDRGAPGSSTRVVTTTASDEAIGFVASADSEGNRSAHRVRVPDQVEVGDRLLLFFSANTVKPTYTAPAGWTALESQDGRNYVSRVYTKVAEAGDAGSDVTISSSSYAKDHLAVVAYRGTDQGTPVSASALQDDSVADHRTPVVQVPDGGGWLVSYWAEKSSTATAWSAPAEVARRASSATTAGSGRMLALVADSNGLVPRGSGGGVLATADAPGRGASSTIVLQAAPGDPGGTGDNRAPEAELAPPSCTGLTCSFDASGSSDPDGDALTYDWDFGDGSPHANGPTTTHAYADGGSRTVTLTVRDAAGATDTSTVEVTPVAPGDPADLARVGAATSVGNRMRHRVAVPDDVRVGDRLVLLMTANSTRPTYTGPAGWTEAAAQDGSGIVLRVWTRLAQPGDPGSTVEVRSSGYAKSNLSVAAYRSAGSSPTLTAIATHVDDSSGADHVSPAVDVSRDGSWVLTYWADKSSSTTAWDLPPGVSSRTSGFGSGSGHIASVLGDSDGPVGPGRAGEQTATANSTSSRGTTVTVVLG